MHSGFIQLMITSLWGISVGIPVISIKFLKIENDLLLQPSDIISEVAFSRVGNWKHNKYFAFGSLHCSELIHTHNISYCCQNIILSSSALGLWVVFKILLTVLSQSKILLEVYYIVDSIHKVRSLELCHIHKKYMDTGKKLNNEYRRAKRRHNKKINNSESIIAPYKY